jgi:hypothetical protein
MTSKFEKLIEHVINDEENEAQALFHEIVVETSREIYENLMDEEVVSEEEESEDDEEKVEEGMMNDGDAADDLITDVETEEEGMSEGEEEMDAAAEFGAEEDELADEEDDIEDRVVDLEDKLDELMAEFEAMMGGEEEAEDEMDADMMDMDADVEMDDEEMMPEMGMMENVDLKAAPKPVTTEPAGTNSKSTVAANSGAKGMAASPVKMTGDTAQGRSAPAAKDMGMTTSPAQSAAPKPVTTQAAGVNTKSPV